MTYKDKIFVLRRGGGTPFPPFTRWFAPLLGAANSLHLPQRLPYQCSVRLESRSWNSLLVSALDSWSKSCEFESWQKRRENFPLQSQLCVLTLIVHSTPVLLQWHIKDPGHSAKSACDRLHLNMHTPLTQQSQSGMTMLLSSYSVEIYQETTSHATHQGTLSHNCLSSLSHCGLILA